MRKTKWWVASAVMLVAVLVWVQFGRPKVTARVYKMGWTDSPPFEVRGADGQPTGLAVDLVRTAARRRGISLQWVYWEHNSERALRDKIVDLWPLMTVTPERLQHFYVSEPYLEAEFCLLVRADSPYTKMQELSTAIISFADRPVDTWQLDRHLPAARRLSRRTRSQVMEDLCQQRSDAALMNSFAGIATLLDKPGVCGEQVLRWIAAPEMRSRLGIGAAFEFRGTADALREEIGTIAAEGKLAPILGQSGYMSQQLESMEALLEARRRGQRLAAAALLFAFLFVVACWQSVRFMRQRNRTRQTEQALRETEQNLRLMANNMKETVLAYDMDRRLIFANPAVETLTGYGIADLEKDRFVNWIHPDDRARMLGYWDAVFHGSGFEDEEYRLITRDGRTKWVSATWGPIRDDAGRQIGVQGSERDITDHKRGALALQASEERYRQITKCVPDLIWATDLSGRFTYANSAVQRNMGWTAEEFLELTLRDVFTPQVALQATANIDEELKKATAPQYDRSTVTTFETEHLRKDGSSFSVEISGTFLWSDDGKPVGLIGTTRDIAERKRAEEEKAKLLAQFHQAQKMESVGRLAGGVAHDFNNLLTVINGYSQMLLGKLSAGDPLRDSLAEILKAGERAAGLTRQLLAFSRKQVLEPRRLDVNRVVEDMRPMLERLVGEDVEVRIALDPEGGTINADPHQLEQVVMNLVVNARDAMPGVGKLLVETAKVERDESHARSHPEARAGRYVMLAVSDTGVGMDEETKSRIFEPFFTTKGVGKGTGLGLSMVQGIVAQSGGYVEVYSEKGTGTTFKIYLPALADAAVDAGGPAAVPVMGGKETVLVVEDQAEVLKYAVAVLKSYGYRVIPVENAGEAMLLCEQERIDLVLTDVVMPNVSGRGLADRLEALQPGIKVLFMSGYTENVIEHDGALEEGAKFIQKPFSPEELARKVREVLGPAVRAARIPVADDEAGVPRFLRNVLENGGYEVLEV
ncbi:MAG: PAS domain S-box protein [Candidatus Solibacter sp.]|jgi:PAS domain S-box-containing protein